MGDRNRTTWYLAGSFVAIVSPCFTPTGTFRTGVPYFRISQEGIETTTLYGPGPSGSLRRSFRIIWLDRILSICIGATSTEYAGTQGTHDDNALFRGLWSCRRQDDAAFSDRNPYLLQPSSHYILQQTSEQCRMFHVWEWTCCHEASDWSRERFTIQITNVRNTNWRALWCFLWQWIGFQECFKARVNLIQEAAFYFISLLQRSCCIEGCTNREGEYDDEFSWYIHQDHEYAKARELVEWIVRLIDISLTVQGDRVNIHVMGILHVEDEPARYGRPLWHVGDGFYCVGRKTGHMTLDYDRSPIVWLNRSLCGLRLLDLLFPIFRSPFPKTV